MSRIFSTGHGFFKKRVPPELSRQTVPESSSRWERAMEPIKKSGASFVLFGVLFLSVSVFILFLPHAVRHTVSAAVSLCVERIVPSLFPFLVLSQLFGESGLQYQTGRHFSKLIARLFGVCETLAGCLLSGLVSGFPSGAKAAGITYKNNLCTKQQAEFAIAVANNPSPAFVVCVAGAASFGKTSAGALLLAAQFLSLIMTARILRAMEPDSADFCPVPDKKEPKDPPAALNIIARAVRESVFLMLVICGFIVFFSVISFFFQSISVLLFGHSRLIKSVVTGFFEISAGIFCAGEIPFHRGILLGAAILGWSGVSVYFQVRGICEEYGLSTKKYLLARSLQTVLCPAAAFLLILLFPGAVPASADGGPRPIRTLSIPHFFRYLAVPFAIFLVLSGFVSLFRVLRKNSNQAVKSGKNTQKP